MNVYCSLEVERETAKESRIYIEREDYKKKKVVTVKYNPTKQSIR